MQPKNYEFIEYQIYVYLSVERILKTKGSNSATTQYLHEYTTVLVDT